MSPLDRFSASALLLLVVACEGVSSDEGAADAFVDGDRDQMGSDAALNGDATLEGGASLDQNVIGDSANVVSPGCAPRADGTCESLGDVRCCGLRGDVFEWNEEKQCRTKLSIPQGEPVLCLAGAAPMGGGACIQYTTSACYMHTDERGRTTLFLTSDDLPSEFFAETGLAKCSPVLENAARVAPSC